MAQSEFDTAVEEARQRNRTGNRAWRIGGAVAGAIFFGIFGAVGSVAGGAWIVAVAIVFGALVGLGIASLVVRSRNRRAAHLSVAANWAARNGWDYRETTDIPAIDLGFLEQGDRRYAEDGASGTIAGHQAEILNFTVEEDRRDADGDRTTDRYPFFLIVIHRAWQGPHVAMTRRSISFGRGWRNALRSSVTGEQAVEMENDAFEKRFQVLLPDDWGKDVAFLLIAPDMQEQMADGRMLADVLQVDATPAFMFLAWKGHFSAEDIPELEERIAGAAVLAERWRDDIPVSMRPLSAPGTPPPPPPMPPAPPEPTSS